MKGKSAMSGQKQFGQLVGMVAQNLPVMTPEEMQRCIGRPRKLQKFLNGIVEAVANAADLTIQTFIAQVDETLSVEEAVKAGNFASSGHKITSENFPKPVGGLRVEREIALFDWDKGAPREPAIIAVMDKAGYKEASIGDLCGLIAKYPHLAKESPIAALGSRCKFHGGRPTAFTYESTGSLELVLEYVEDEWRRNCRFAGVRK